MSESGSSYAAPGLPGIVPPPAETDRDGDLRDLLKRCSPETLAAAQRFRRTQRAELVPAIVAGVLVRHMDRDKAPILREPRADLRLVEDLGLDSLSLIEVSMTLEDVFQVTLPDDKLRQLKSLGDINRLAAESLKA